PAFLLGATPPCAEIRSIGMHKRLPSLSESNGGRASPERRWHARSRRRESLYAFVQHGTEPAAVTDELCHHLAKLGTQRQGSWCELVVGQAYQHVAAPDFRSGEWDERQLLGGSARKSSSRLDGDAETGGHDLHDDRQ